VRRGAWLASATALASIAVAGCGGGALSMSELRTQATRVCLVADTATGRIPTPASPNATDPFLRRGIAVLAPELAQLRALKAPSDVADVYSTALLAFSRKLNALKSALHGLDRGADPVSAVQGLQHRLGPIESAEDGAWQALQIPACVNR
jgi:hypothetical protein